MQWIQLYNYGFTREVPEGNAGVAPSSGLGHGSGSGPLPDAPTWMTCCHLDPVSLTAVKKSLHLSHNWLETSGARCSKLLRLRLTLG